MIYGKCECGGKIIETRISYYRKFNKKIYVFENVPIGICKECGERIFKGEVLERLEEISKNSNYISKELKIPIYSYI